MTVAHIVFDLDGTLIDSVEVCTCLVNEMLADRGCSACVSRTLVRRYISVGGAKMIAALLGQACRDPERDLKEFRARYARLATPEDSLFPGVRDGLSELMAAGYGLAICSNKPQALCEKVLNDLRLSSFFTAVVGGDSVDKAKPHPKHLDCIIRLIGGQRSSCVMVGDSDVDLMLARNAEVPFILVEYGYGDFSERPDDALCAPKFSDVAHLVNSCHCTLRK